MFRKGMKVVCVDAMTRTGRPTGLLQGGVYTVSGTNTCRCNKFVVSLNESDGFDASRCNVCGFVHYGDWSDAMRFRPLLDADLEEQVNELEEQTVEA